MMTATAAILKELTIDNGHDGRAGGTANALLSVVHDDGALHAYLLLAVVHYMLTHCWQCLLTAGSRALHAYSLLAVVHYLLTLCWLSCITCLLTAGCRALHADSLLAVVHYMLTHCWQSCITC